MTDGLLLPLTHAWPSLPASANTPLGQTLVVYQWLRAEQLDQWWHWILLATVCALILSYVWYWYKRDAVEQHRPVGWALALLRIAAFTGLVLYFMQLDKRTEQRVVRDSKVAVLVDTSLSMSLSGTPSPGGVTSPITRAEEATRLVGQSDFLQQLADQHQVSVYRFDQLDRPAALAAIDKSLSSADSDARQQPPSNTASNESGAPGTGAPGTGAGNWPGNWRRGNWRRGNWRRGNWRRGNWQRGNQGRGWGLCGEHSGVESFIEKSLATGT